VVKQSGNCQSLAMKVIFLNPMLTGSIFAPESILQIYADENFYCGIIFAARILLCSSAARIKSGNVDENTRARKKERKKGGEGTPYPATAIRAKLFEKF